MPLRDDLLSPIPGENPSGANLYYSPVFDQIREARRQDDQGPAGLWEHDRKTADHNLVIRVASEALATKTKDLQLAAWLAEALTWQKGFPGLKDGLDLLRGLVEQFWDSVYPELEDGDVEFRASPIEWLGNYLEPAKGTSPALAVSFVALTANGLGLMKYNESRKVGYEKDASSSDAQKARKQAIAEGKIPAEEFDTAFDATPKAFYKALTADVKACLESVRALSDLCDEKFGRAAPGFSSLRSALEEVQNTTRILLKKKLEQDPDPVEVPEVPPAEGEVAAAGIDAGRGPAVATPPVAGLEPEADDGSIVGLRPASAPEAIRRISAAARYLRAAQPASPVSYIVLRALRWGELMASGPELNPSLLVPPSTEVRVRLKALATQGRWADVLEVSESAMASEAGRGWLDIQRYSIRACEELGHTAAAQAMRSALARFLKDYPTLPTMTLMDDTGTANPDTAAWIADLVSRAG